MPRVVEMRMEMWTRTLVVIAAVTLACTTAGIDTPIATATPLPQAIAPVSADVPIAAGNRWLIWSVPVEGGWGLEAYRDGALTALSLAPSPQPFDLKVGTDRRGAPVATFSRCTRTPRMEGVGSEVIGGSMLIPRSGAGCRLHVLELSSGRESLLPIPHPADTSDTTPSMWHGNVAFARMTSGHGDISQVMLWSPRHPHVLRILPHGAIPPYCAGKARCHGQPVYGEVQALDLDGDVVTFTWSIKAPDVTGHGGWEVRVDDLADSRTSLAGSGIVGEACTGGAVELERLEAPIAVGDGVLFSEFKRSGCYQTFTSWLHGDHTGAAHPSFGLLPGVVFGLAKDGDAIYALAAPVPTHGIQTNPSCSSAAPCTLERIAKPALTVSRFKPEPPFASFVYPAASGTVASPVV